MQQRSDRPFLYYVEGNTSIEKYQRQAPVVATKPDFEFCNKVMTSYRHQHACGKCTYLTIQIANNNGVDQTARVAQTDLRLCCSHAAKSCFLEL